MTHSFDKSVIDTVIQDNINPIEKVEQSALILASTIYQVSPTEILNESAQIVSLNLLNDS